MIKNYRFLNNITGWMTFAIAAITYLSTIEPTISFWDCGEFTTTAYNLQVGHPPGNPFFMIVGRFFTLFVDSVYAGMMVNAMSALASAFTILFLFWTITHLAKKIFSSAAQVTASGSGESSTRQIKKTEDGLTTGQTITILGSGVVGALAYTFTDTFWFSAVESEVYALSSLFTAIVFWAILKWENVADEPHANRWIIFIAYMIGLSIGVHLLNLLAIPAIVFVWYFKKYKVTRKGVLGAFIVSMLLLGLIMYGVIPWVIKVASWFELLFINGLGLPFNTGVLIYIIILIGLTAFGLYYTMKKQKVFWNTALLAFTVIVIGYSSFAIIVIRSSANTPMDQNSPDNVFSLLSYVNREQYGDRPLFYGQQFNTPLDVNEPYVRDKSYYIQRDGRYVIAHQRTKPNYDSRFTTIFPRMWSSDPGHIEEYKNWSHFKGRPISFTDQDGQKQTIPKPTFVENIQFFLRYQVVHMYMRYFMWNFVGRQNDTQGNGDIINGNWLSGVNFIDSARLGDQKSLPDSLRNNKGRNAYYFLPLLLGLAGAFFHYKRHQKDFWVVMLLFIMTGIAIVVYLNQYPNQPRERDYAYAGSFYAFAIWIGLGVMSLAEALKRWMPETVSAIGVSALSLVLVPVIMASENWDDHDRSNRYTARDLGANYLETCDRNAIIFCNGDNETFPLWYNQEVEGRRLDMRVCNLSYLQTDWYIDQMKRKVHESEPLPISFTHDQYVQGTRDVIYLINDTRIQGPVELSKALEFVKSDDPKTKLTQYDNTSYIPSKKLFLKVDKEAVIRNKVVPGHLYDQIVDTIFFDFSSRNYLVKDEMILLDMIANSNWERPLYFAITMGREKFLGLMDYFQLEGLAYRFTPVKTAKSGYNFGSVYTSRLYDNMMNRFSWGNMNDPEVYIDETNRRMMMTVRSTLNRLAENFIIEDKKDRAIEVLDRNLDLVPPHAVPYDYLSQMTARYYFEAGATEKGRELQNEIFKVLHEQLEYYTSLNERFTASIEIEIQRIAYYMHDLAKVAVEFGQEDQAKEINDALEGLLKSYGS